MTEASSVDEQHLFLSCPLCSGRRLYYAFSLQKYRVVRCATCSLLLLNPQPSDAELSAIHNAPYLPDEDTPEGRARITELKAATDRHYLQQLGRYRGPGNGSLLEIGCGRGDFLLQARHEGYDVTGVEVSPAAAALANERLGANRVTPGILEDVTLEDRSFDVCVLSDVIEHTRDPMQLLAIIRRLLKPNGALFITTPSLDSRSARLLRQNWMEFKPKNLTYFSGSSIQTLLHLAGFDQIIVQTGWKVLNLNNVAQHFESFPVAVVSTLVRMVTRLTPKRLRHTNFHVLHSNIAVFCRPAARPERRKLSVVVPAYNESGTLQTMMDLLLKKQLQDIDIEIIVVESNSTDGTREIAMSYQNHPRVKLVLEDRPHGKGHAVRTGFQHMTGDFVMIQDADLEYDMEDYDALIEPLAQGRTAFVLGSRHGGKAWKMRHFADQRLMSMGLNAGHWFFTTLINILFWQRLRDPFTMFKVFRRDCLAGLHFECNRFDFDYELLIKLIRKGYIPIEIPVNYRSRSFKEGKKVSVWRDPLTWVAVLARLRLTSINPMAEIERQRKLQQHANTASNPVLAALPLKNNEKS